MPDLVNSPLNLNLAKSQRVETGYIDVNGRWWRTHEDIGFMTGAITDATALKINDPGQSFLHFRFESDSTGGDERGMYLKLLLSGTAQYGDAIRPVTRVTADAVGTASATGIHATLALPEDSLGSLTGQGCAGRFTLEAEPCTDSLSGTLSALLVESYIGAGITRRGDESFIRAVDVGAVKMPQFFSAVGCTAGATNAFETDAGAVGGTIKGYIRGLWPDGTQVYLVAYTSHA